VKLERKTSSLEMRASSKNRQFARRVVEVHSNDRKAFRLDLAVAEPRDHLA
jgi:hypothetical protein